MVFFLEGRVGAELATDMRGLMHESCALSAAVDEDDASHLAYYLLALQQHRGEGGSGIVSCDKGRLYSKRELGRATSVFNGFDFSRLPGDYAIGHNRYATHGDPFSQSNVQPLLFQRTPYGPLAIGHNGTFAGTGTLMDSLDNKGAVFQSSSDSELFIHAMAASGVPTLEEAVISATVAIPAAYSMLILSPGKMIALRDRFGVRPLSYAKLNGGYLIASENYALDQISGAENIAEVGPGQMVIFDHGSLREIQYADPDEGFCVFEGIYFSNPRTRCKGYYYEDFRKELGRMLGRENPGMAGDLVVPILNSGKYAAIGLAEALGIPYTEAFLRVFPPIAERSFTSPTKEERERVVHEKLHLREDMISGKRIITADDSIVRATTQGIINDRLRDAGAEYIVNCIASPPIMDICPYGMDFQTRDELAAYNRPIEDIRKIVRADELYYLTLPGLHGVVSKTIGSGICSGCFGGAYPMGGR